MNGFSSTCFCRAPRSGGRLFLLGIAAMLCALIVPRANAVVQLRTSVDPFFVDVQVGPVQEMLTAGGPNQDEIVESLVEQIRLAAIQRPGLITLKPKGFTLSYKQLPEWERQVMETDVGDADVAQRRYERTIASMLHAAVTRARAANPKLRVSIAGLPIEADPSANSNYAEVIDGLNAFVSDRDFGATGASVLRDMASSVDLANGRPIYYLNNESWMVAVGTKPPPVFDTPKVARGRSGYKASGSSRRGGSAGAGSRGGGGGGGGGGSRGGRGKSAAKNNQATIRVNASDGDEGSGMASAGAAQPRPKLFVNEPTSEAVKNQYPNYHAKDAIIIYGSAIDPDDNGVLDDPDLWVENLTALVPANHNGPVALDWEGNAILGLLAPVGSAIHNQAVGEYVKVIKKAKEVRPNAKFGFYGLPIGTYYPTAEWEAKADGLAPIFAESQCLFPSVYDQYKDGEFEWHTAENDHDVAKAIVKLALKHSDGKPVYAYVWHRWHDTNPVNGMKIIPDDEFKAHVSSVFDVNYQGDKVDGLVWWGADLYWLWLTQQGYTPSHPNYAEAMLAQQLFAEEISPGVTPQAHFNQLHLHTLQMLKDVIDDAY